MAHGTEHVGPQFKGFDTWRTGEVLETLLSSQSRAMAACFPALPALERAVDGAVERLAAGQGRLIYMGVGSSGMIGALDALELGGTFDWPESRTAIVLAGALDFTRSPDLAAEDDVAGGRQRAHEMQLTAADVVLGVSAGGSSPVTVAFVEEARKQGAMTVAFVSVAGSALVRAAEHAIVVATGAEVIAGSTRLAAGTAQKVMLNLFSTAVMVRLGLVFDNLMIGVRPGNAKLRQRRASIVASIAGVEREVAADALTRYGDVKLAVLGLAGLSQTEAEAALADAGGNLRRALRSVQRGTP